MTVLASVLSVAWLAALAWLVVHHAAIMGMVR